MEAFATVETVVRARAGGPEVCVLKLAERVGEIQFVCREDGVVRCGAVRPNPAVEATWARTPSCGGLHWTPPLGTAEPEGGSG